MSQGGAGEFPGRMTAGTQREDTSSVILQLSITLHTSWMLTHPHPHPGITAVQSDSGLVR